MHICATERLGADFLPRRRLHQWRTAQKDGPLTTDDDGLVGHCRHVGPARGAGTHYHCNLGNSGSRHIGLVEKNAAEMLPVGEYLILSRQIGAPGINQVDTGQAVLLRYRLRSEMFFDRNRVVGATLDGGVIDDQHAVAAVNLAHSRDDSSARNLVIVELPPGQLRKLEKTAAGVQ